MMRMSKTGRMEIMRGKERMREKEKEKKEMEKFRKKEGESK